MKFSTFDSKLTIKNIWVHALKFYLLNELNTFKVALISELMERFFPVMRDAVTENTFLFFYLLLFIYENTRIFIFSMWPVRALASCNVQACEAAPPLVIDAS